MSFKSKFKIKKSKVQFYIAKSKMNFKNVLQTKKIVKKLFRKLGPSILMI